MLLNSIIKHASESPSRIAVEEGQDSWTYHDLSEYISLACCWLQRSGIAQGDRVQIFEDSGFAFVGLYFAIHAVGGVAVVTSAQTSRSRLAFITEETKPKLCIRDPSITYTEIIKDVEGFQPLWNYLRLIDPNSIADIMFTSGTTASPKCVPLTHRQIFSATEHICRNVTNSEHDIELILLPFSHSFALGRMRSIMYAGGRMVLGVNPLRPKKVYDEIRRRNVSGIGLVPSLLKFLLRSGEERFYEALSHIKYIELGSEFLTPKLKSELKDRLPNSHIVMHYGSTEISRAIYLNFRNDNLKSVGRVDGATSVRIQPATSGEANSESQEVIVGEILLRAPWMFSGYLQSEGSGNRNLSQAPEYFATGDIGFILDQYLFLEGRLDDVFKVSGKKLSPYEVEAAYADMPEILECVCMPMDDEVFGALVHLLVVPRDPTFAAKTQQDRLKEVIKEWSASLPAHYRPGAISILDSLPKTDSGKIARSLLKEQKWAS